MAKAELEIPQLKSNLTMLGLVVRFSPLTMCSLSTTCLTSPECPHYFSLHGCSRLSCQAPSDLPGFCPRHDDLLVKTLEHEEDVVSALSVAGVAGGILLVVLVVGVLVYGIRRLDGRPGPGRWQAIQSVFQPGYQVFRSGEEVGEGGEVHQQVVEIVL